MAPRQRGRHCAWQSCLLQFTLPLADEDRRALELWNHFFHQTSVSSCRRQNLIKQKKP